jgi:hypothetical protein
MNHPVIPLATPFFDGSPLRGSFFWDAVAERPTGRSATASKILCEAPQALSSQNRGFANGITFGMTHVLSAKMAEVLHLGCLFH